MEGSPDTDSSLALKQRPSDALTEAEIDNNEVEV